MDKRIFDIADYFIISRKDTESSLTTQYTYYNSGKKILRITAECVVKPYEEDWYSNFTKINECNMSFESAISELDEAISEPNFSVIAIMRDGSELSWNQFEALLYNYDSSVKTDFADKFASKYSSDFLRDSFGIDVSKKISSQNADYNIELERNKSLVKDDSKVKPDNFENSYVYQQDIHESQDDIDDFNFEI